MQILWLCAGGCIIYWQWGANWTKWEGREMQTRHFPFLCFGQIKTANMRDGKYSVLGTLLLTDYWQNWYLSCNNALCIDCPCYQMEKLIHRPTLRAIKHQFTGTEFKKDLVQQKLPGALCIIWARSNFIITPLQVDKIAPLAVDNFPNLCLGLSLKCLRAALIKI